MRKLWLTLVVGLATGICGSLLLTPARGVAAPVPSLDDVPGLGVSSQAQIRDDEIAYWEAWQRDVATSDCMRRAGFMWEPEALYPEDGVVRVGRELGVAPSVGAAKTIAPVERNAATRNALSPARRDLYIQTLTGESAADVASVESSGGELPAGANSKTFAQRGCMSAGGTQSVWDLKRSLGPELLTLRQQARQTAVFQAQLSAYTGCVAAYGLANVVSPAQLEEFRSSPQEPVAAKAEAACDVYWRSANDQAMLAVGGDFLAKHSLLINTQRAKYDSVPGALRGDVKFKQFLADELSRASGA